MATCPGESQIDPLADENKGGICCAPVIVPRQTERVVHHGACHTMKRFAYRFPCSQNPVDLMEMTNRVITPYLQLFMICEDIQAASAYRMYQLRPSQANDSLCCHGSRATVCARDLSGSLASRTPPSLPRHKDLKDGGFSFTAGL